MEDLALGGLERGMWWRSQRQNHHFVSSHQLCYRAPRKSPGRLPAPSTEERACPKAGGASGGPQRQEGGEVCHIQAEGTGRVVTFLWGLQAGEAGEGSW